MVKEGVNISRYEKLSDLWILNWNESLVLCNAGRVAVSWCSKKAWTVKHNITSTDGHLPFVDSGADLSKYTAYDDSL